MRMIFALVALLGGLAGPRLLLAQGIYGLTPPRPGDLPVAPNRGTTSEKRPTSGWYSSSGFSSVRGALIKPSGSVSVSRVSYIYLSPATIALPQPVVILPGLPQNREEERTGERIPPPRPREVDRPMVPEEFDPGTPASVFWPIRPEEHALPGMPPAREPARPAMPEPEKSLPPPRELPPLPGPPTPAADPKTASVPLVQSGKEAFLAHEYSLAERHFRRAMEAFPEDPGTYFLLAQARFAQRKYAEAVTAIHAGMRLQPDWPSAGYRSRDLYGTDRNAFTDHLKRLADAMANHPDDPFLPFLLGHELWFDNRKEEARMMFWRAKALAPDPSFSERYLRSKADSPVNNAVVELLRSGSRF